MKIRSACLLGTAFLFAAIPLRADGIACSGFGGTFRNTTGPIQTIASQCPEFHATADTVFLAQFPEEGSLAGTFRAKCNPNVPTSEPTLSPELVLAPPMDDGARAANVDLRDSYGRASAFIRINGNRTEEHGDKHANGGRQNSTAVSAPEPGALALSLFGVICVGLLVRRPGLTLESREVDVLSTESADAHQIAR